MVNKVARVRFVRCPKCLKLLPEFADVPMYQCGGCGAVLESKNYNTDTSCASPRRIDPWQGTSDNASLNGYCHENEKGESSETIEKREESSDVDGRSNRTTFSEDEQEEDKSLNLSERGSDTLIGPSRSEEEIIDEGRQSNSGLSSPAAAVASLDNGSPDRVWERYQYPVSRRTSRNQRSSSSGCSNMAKRTSLGSESFYSVRTWIGSEDLSVREFESTSAKLKKLNQSRSELLKLVEELKHQLGRSHERKESKTPDLCCNGSSCHAAGSHNFGCHSPKAKGPPRCACSAASSSYAARKSRPPGAKRFFRPVLGGAPFVICYKCFEMLHMPADLLISTNKLNKLKCGACSEILPLPFPAARARPGPQASSAEYYGDSPEEYGVSVAESCLTEIGPALNMSSDESRDVDGPGLPLHRVMGYPSARLLLY